MKKVVVLLLSCLMVVGLFCGCKQKKSKDTQISEVHRFTYKMATGSMLLKDDMNDDEKKMHDAKVLQYGAYKLKSISSNHESSENVRLINEIYTEIKDSLFYETNPSDWLSENYQKFEGDLDFLLEKYGMSKKIHPQIPKEWASIAPYYPINPNQDQGFILPEDYPDRQESEEWNLLNSHIDAITVDCNNYIGMNIEQRSKIVEYKDKFLPILKELTSYNFETIYRDPDGTKKYILGTQPEPTQETILFAQDNLQKILNVAAMGDMSTITLTEECFKNMTSCFKTMLEDYQATRDDPTIENMQQWGIDHVDLWRDWNKYLGYVGALKAIFAEDLEN